MKTEVEKGVMLHTLTKAWSSQKLLEPPLGPSKRASPLTPSTLILHSYHPELSGNTFLCFKPPRLLQFVEAALGMEHSGPDSHPLPLSPPTLSTYPDLPVTEEKGNFHSTILFQT